MRSRTAERTRPRCTRSRQARRKQRPGAVRTTHLRVSSTLRAPTAPLSPQRHVAMRDAATPAKEGREAAAKDGTPCRACKKIPSYKVLCGAFLQESDRLSCRYSRESQSPYASSRATFANPRRKSSCRCAGTLPALDSRESGTDSGTALTASRKASQSAAPK